jgi:hypothetical protein
MQSSVPKGPPNNFDRKIQMNTKPQTQGQKEGRDALDLSLRGLFIQTLNTMATICDQLLNLNQANFAGSFAVAHGQPAVSYPMYCSKPGFEHRFSSISSTRGSEWPHSIRGGNSLSRRGRP